MSNKSRILILCTNVNVAHDIEVQLANDETEPMVATSISNAIMSLRDHSFDMLLVESQVGKSSGLSFLSEANKRLPSMLRVVIETKPIDINMHALVNEVAPSAIFSKVVDPEKVWDLLSRKRLSGSQGGTAMLASDAEGEGGAGEGDEKPAMTEAQKMEFILDVSMQMNGMVEDPNLALPVMPEIALRVRELMADENCDFESVAEMVESEQGMASRILQVANSPIYAGLERIRNMQGAVARLGLRETRNILQVVIAQNLFRTSARSLSKLMQELWLHSLCVAYSNEVIAQRLEIKESQDYFMMGLLHDIGKLLIIHLVELGRRRSLWGDVVITEEIVNKIMGLRHLDLGARLLDKWHYPAQMRDVVRLHNDGVSLHHRDEHVVVTYFSNLIARKIGLSLVPYEGDPLSNKELADVLNISSQVREEIEGSIRDLTEKIRQSCLVG